MAILIPELAEALGMLAEALGILATIRALLGDTAQQDDLATVETTTLVTKNAVTNVVSGTAAIWGLLETLQSGGTPSLATITALIDGLTPVSLPPTPPVDWPGEIAAGITGVELLMPWFVPETLIRTLDVALFETQAVLMGTVGATGFPSRKAPDFAIVGRVAVDMWSAVHTTTGAGEIPMPTETDWSNWDGSESLVAFLTRTWPAYVWGYNGPEGYTTLQVAWGRLEGYADILLRCLVPEWQLPWVSGRLWDALRGLSIGLPPIWPGLPGATLGTPVVLTDSGVITAPMHGLLLTIDSVKPGVGHWGTDGYENSYRSGYVAFLTDTGAVEGAQYLGWNTAIYLPKSMKVAAGALLVLGNALQVTVTPFTIP